MNPRLQKFAQQDIEQLNRFVKARLRVIFPRSFQAGPLFHWPTGIGDGGFGL